MKNILVFVVFFVLFSACKKVNVDPSSYGISLVSATLIPDGGAGGLRFRVSGFYEGPEDISFDSIGIVALSNPGDWEFYPGTYQYVGVPQKISPGIFEAEIQLSLGSTFNNLALFSKSGDIRLKTNAVPISDIYKRGVFIENAYYKFDGNNNDNNNHYNMVLNTAVIPTYSSGVSSSVNANDLAFDFNDGVTALSNPILGNEISGNSARTFSFRIQYTQASTVFYFGDDLTSRLKVSVNLSGGLVIDVGSSTYTFGSALNAGAGNWNHVIIQMPVSATEADIVVYVNGIQQSSSPVGGTTQIYIAQFQPFWIGAGYNGASASSGMLLDDFRVWNKWIPKPYVNLISLRD